MVRRRRGGDDVGRLVGRRVVVVTSGLLLVVPKEGFLLRIVLRLFDPGCFGRFLRLYGLSLLDGGGSEVASFPGTVARRLGLLLLAGGLAGTLDVSGRLGEISGLPILVKRFFVGVEAEENGDDCFSLIVAIV